MQITLNRLRWLTTLLALVCLFACLIPTNSTNAQSVTSVLLTPSQQTLLNGETQTFDVSIRGGENLNAFEIEITYDPQIVMLVKFTPENYLSNLFLVHKDEQPGKIRLAYAQLATEGVSGEGELISFQFQGLAAGLSPIIIEEIILADSAGQLIYPSGGQATVEVLPEIFLSATPSRTATAAPTKTFVPSASATIEPTEIVTMDPTNTATRQPTATPTFSITNKATESELVNQSSMTTNPQQSQEPFQHFQPGEVGEPTAEPLSTVKNAVEGGIMPVSTGTEEANIAPLPKSGNQEFQPQKTVSEALLETFKWVILSFSMGGSLIMLFGLLVRIRK